MYLAKQLFCILVFLYGISFSGAVICSSYGLPVFLDEICEQQILADKALCIDCIDELHCEKHTRIMCDILDIEQQLVFIQEKITALDIDLKATRIVMPTDGIVVERLVNEGEMVRYGQHVVTIKTYPEDKLLPLYYNGKQNLEIEYSAKNGDFIRKDRLVLKTNVDNFLLKRTCMVRYLSDLWHNMIKMHDDYRELVCPKYPGY